MLDEYAASILQSTHESTKAPKLDIYHLNNDWCEGLKTCIIPILYWHENWSLNITGEVYTSKSNAMCRALKMRCKELFCAFWIHIHIWPHTLITTMNYLCEISTMNNMLFWHLDSSWYQPLTPFIERRAGISALQEVTTNTVKNIFFLLSGTLGLSGNCTIHCATQSPWTVAYIYIFCLEWEGVVRHKNKSTHLTTAQRGEAGQSVLQLGIQYIVS